METELVKEIYYVCVFSLLSGLFIKKQCYTNEILMLAPNVFLNLLTINEIIN